MARIAICGGSIAKGATRVQKKSKAKNASNVSNTPTLATCKFVDDETQEYYDTKTNKEIRSPGYEERIVFFHNGGFTMYTGTDDECICEGVNGLRNCVEQGGLPGEVYHGSGFDSGLKWIIGNRFFVGIGGWGEASKSDKKWALETFEEVVVYTGGI